VSEIEATLARNFVACVDELKAFCAISSVSTDPAHRSDIRAAAAWVAGRLGRAGLEHVDIIETGGHPAVVADWLHAPGAPTILVYGHYDVQPPDPLDKWISPPFEPTIRDDRLYARGASDDKGPLLIPILVAEAFLAERRTLPINLKFLIEGEEEIGSPRFADTVARLQDRLACDLVVSADGAMWRPDLPSLTIASRGLVALDIFVTGAAKDLHSGRHGGSAPNPIRALVAVLATMHDADGRVVVPGFLDGATPPDPRVREAIELSGFDAARYFDEIGAPKPEPGSNGAELLVRQWLQPTLEFNGISGGYAGPGTKTVIPSQASVKITCRLVAGQEPELVVDAIARHVETHLSSGYRFEIVRHGRGSKAFALDPELPALPIFERILQDLTGKAPLRVAMGATIPIGGVFRDALGAPTVFFSFSTSDEDYHAPNEFFRLQSFRDGLIAWARAFQALTNALPD
jgi:acetylornithine deacetylase/succinyl-diaminopimelate desuccinylase-like protein